MNLDIITFGYTKLKLDNILHLEIGLLMSLIFLFISSSLFSQSIFDNTTSVIYVDNKVISDVVSIKDSGLKPIIYMNKPDFSDLAIMEKKAKFIDFILPTILIEKEKIKRAYNYVLKNFDSIYYEMNDTTKYLYDYCNCNTPGHLLVCLTEQPNSIAIAQAAIESGWGTSRFFLEGNNLFGIHTHSADSSKLEANNSSLIYVKKYNNIGESISHYLRTLAGVSAYSLFRESRANSEDVMCTIRFLHKYSERRGAYIDDLETIIDYNNLLYYDSLTFY
tara:strand:- start:3062 stop:3892 length:831 start_codon:yes stop_codon:yes gene_type:complete